MKSEREFTGKLLGFDDFVSEFSFLREFQSVSDVSCLDMVLDDVTELYAALHEVIHESTDIHPDSEYTPTGRKETKLKQTLLNGNNICMVCAFEVYCSFFNVLWYQIQLVPGSSGPSS